MKLSLLPRLRVALFGRKNAFPTSPCVTKYAFTSGGIDYFEMDDLFNIPWQRGMEAVHAYEELAMNCDRKYLVEHTAFVNEILTAPKFGLSEAMQLKAANDQLRQRLNWVVLPDLAYRLASVVYFDASENPLRYELGYAKKKIEHWKENDDVEAFFLRTPVRKLMPFLNGFEGSFPHYSEMVRKVNDHHLQNLSSKFSKSNAAAASDNQ